MKILPYAEDVKHYWKTSTSAPDVWIQRAKAIIEEINGHILAEGFGSANGRAAYMLAFKINDSTFKVVFPVLPTYYGKEMDAKRQAATLLYHDVKAKAMIAKVFGAEVAFFSYMMLPDGRVSSELAAPELANSFPKLLN